MTRTVREWPRWIDDVLAYAPIAELGPEWQSAVGDAIVRVLDLRQGSREVTCACCGATRIVPGAAA